MMQSDQVEAVLEKEFGSSISDQQMRYFYEEENWIGQVMKGDQDINWLIDKVRRYLRSVGKVPTERRVQFVAKTKKTAITRDDARSTILAHAAAREDSVIEFRKAHLKDKLISFGEVEEWLKKAFEKDWAGQPKKREPGKAPVFLEYAKPGDSWTYRIQIAPGGLLEELNRIAKILSAKFDWQIPQAVVFLLTGLEPWVPSIRADVISRRIILSVTPATTSQELARHYREIKKRMGVSRRIKNLTEKHLRLAIAACERERDGKEWKPAFREWNKATKRKEDKYSQESNFRRDALKARERLMNL